MSKELNRELCAGFVSRAAAQGKRGKRRDADLIEYTAGAIAALLATGHKAEADHLAMVGHLLLATRAFAECERLAIDTELAENKASAEAMRQA
jgi:hypothetical protein